MKSVSILLLVALTLSVLQDQAEGQVSLFAPTCCSNVTQILIPKKKVKRLVKTPSSCAVNAIIVITKAQKQICVDPESDMGKKLRAWKY